MLNKSVSYGSFALLFVFSIIYAKGIYSDLSIFHITWVGIVFSAPMVALFAFIDRRTSNSERLVSRVVYVFQLIILSTFLILFFLSAFESVFVGRGYVKAFPLSDYPHVDTAFHVSLIQSILNFGYPSTGQHGTPILVYHVLSHYLDAFIILITKINTYDHYALLFIFKSALFVCLSFRFIMCIPMIKSFGHAMILAAFFLPFACGSWHAIGSHGLSYASIFVISSAHYIYKFISNDSERSLKNYLTMFALIVFVSLAKVSSGLALFVFVASIIFLREISRIAFWFFASSVSVFFLIYNSFFSAGMERDFNFGFSFSRFVSDFFYPSELIGGHLLVMQFVCVAFLFFSYYTKERIYLRYVFSLLTSMVFLSALPQVLSGLSESDKFYFYFGFVQIVYPFFVIAAFHLLIRKCSFPLSITNHTPAVVLSSTCLILFFGYTIRNFDLSKFNFFSFKGLDIGRTLTTANYWPYLSKGSILSGYFGSNIKKTESAKVKINFIKLRESISEVVSQIDSSLGGPILYIPKGIWIRDIVPVLGPMSGLYFYAALGIPLAYSVQGPLKYYGFVSYREESFIRDSGVGVVNSVCQSLATRFVIEMVSIERPSFRIVDCPESDARGEL